MTTLCAWCEAPKQGGDICPSCGADYAKAEAIKKHGRVLSASDHHADFTEPDSNSNSVDNSPNYETIVGDEQYIDKPQRERLICWYALPGMLFGAWLVQWLGLFDGLQSIVFGKNEIYSSCSRKLWNLARLASSSRFTSLVICR